MATYAQELADFVCKLQLKDVPEEIRRLARFSALDGIGVMLAGHQTESARIAVDLVRSHGGSPESTIFGAKDRLPAPAAAFANGVAAHSTELDDHIAHTRSMNHPGVVTFPAAFAVAEKMGASGEQLLVSAVTGYEINSRINGAVPPGFFNFERSFHGTAICGPFGAAATASPLLGLNRDQLVNAFGICGSMAAGSFEFHSTGAWTKRFHAGWSSQAGITAAQLALGGFTGPPSIFEGNHGFFQAYAGEGNYDLELLTSNLGQDFEFRFIMYKPFACAGVMHSPLTAALRILREHHVGSDQIESVTVKTSETLVRRFATPTEHKVRPQTQVDAQFSLPYSIAALLYFGRAFLEEYSEAALHDPEVLTLASRVHCVSDPDINRRWPQEEPSEVTVQMKNGSEYTAAVDFGKGSLADPMTEDELKDKFRSLASMVLKESAIERIIELAANIENLPNVKNLIAVIRDGLNRDRTR